MRPKRPLTDSDLRLARIFCKIVECDGIAAAEEELGVGRSTISRQLQDFEARVGIVLCKRGRGGFSLTPAGVQTLSYVEGLLAAVDDFATHVAGLSATVEGKLKIGLVDCSASDPHNPIGRIFKLMQSSTPNVVLDVTVGSPKELERKVLESKLHFAVAPEYWFNEALEYVQLYQEAVGLFAGQDHEAARRQSSGETLTKAEIQGYPLVYRSMPEPPALHRRKSGFRAGPRVLSTEAVLALVRSGCYFGFLPTHLAATPWCGLVELLPDEFGYEMPFCLIYKKDRPHSVILQRFLRAVNRVRHPSNLFHDHEP